MTWKSLDVTTVIIVGGKICIKNFSNLCNIPGSGLDRFTNSSYWFRLNKNAIYDWCFLSSDFLKFTNQFKASTYGFDAPCSCSNTVKRLQPTIVVTVSSVLRASFPHRWEITNVINFLLLLFSCSTQFQEISTCVCLLWLVIYAFCSTLS